MARGISTNRNIGGMAGCLHDAQIAFACRYYSFTTSQTQKRLTRAEAQKLIAAHLPIVAVYEDGPTELAYFSHARGETDAKHAVASAKAVGQPVGSAIYFAVDYDARPSDVDGGITQYFAGVKASLEALGGGQAMYRIGVYGSGRVCAHIKDAMRLASYAWLAESHRWAGHDAYAKPDIRQEISTSTLCTLESGSHGMYEDNFANGEYGAFDALDGVVDPAEPAMSALLSTRAGVTVAPSAFAKKLALRASDQYERYHLYEETASPLKEQIEVYWKDLNMAFPGVEVPWSAVFISWLVRTAGAAPAEFRVSNGHSRYVHWAIKNRENQTGLFRAYPVTEYGPQVGDIVHHNRNGLRLTYGFAAAHESYDSHAVVVVERGSDAGGEYAIAVGGNESHTVGRKRIALDAGGYIAQRSVNPYICVIQNLK